MNQAADLPLQGSECSVQARTELVDVVEEIYRAHYRDLYAYLCLSGCDSGDAEEYLQEAFLRLVNWLRQKKTISNPKYWLLKVLHNIRFDERRRTSRLIAIGTGECPEVPVSNTPPQEKDTLRNERMERLRLAMSQLTDRQYQYMLLRAEGLKLREIAQLFHVSIASVAECCGRAMEKLGRMSHD